MRTVLAIVLSLLVALPAAAGAQGANNAAKAKAEAEVRAADVGMWEAVNTCDVAKWNKIVADDLVLIIIGGRIFDKPTLRDDFFGKTMHPVPCDTEYTNEPMRVRVYGDGAVVTGNVSYKGNGKGRPRGIQRFVYTRLFEKRGGTWQLVHGQHTTTKERIDKGF
jgi:ketosteroid isomerase-like protein